MINHTINEIITGESTIQDTAGDGYIKVSGNKEKVFGT